MIAFGCARTAAITGGFVALALAVNVLRAKRTISTSPIKRHVAAISVGILDGAVRLDLDYDEDSTADVDMNVVATGDGSLVEVQGTAEGRAFGRDQLDAMIDAALLGIGRLKEAQERALATRT